MKLIRQSRLAFRQGKSDKVYEVDLCEVGPGRFVVNFRFGRAGTQLKEGSSTALPVDMAEAERVFGRLVSEKIQKGYLDVGPAVSEGAGAASESDEIDEIDVRFEDLQDPRSLRIVEMLAGRATGWTNNRSRLIWRAGELRLRDAAPLIAATDPGADHRLAWNIARALLRCEDPSTLPAVRTLAGDDSRPSWVRSMARHAVDVLARLDLSDPLAHETFLAEQRAAIPPGILGAVEAGHPIPRGTELPAELFDLLYLVSPGAPFLALLANVPIEGAAFEGVRRVLKAAEARADGEVWGLLVRRIERERKAGGDKPRPTNLRKGQYFYFHKGGTRKYLRRRSWRTLRRLGEVGIAPDYVAMATGLLLAYSDSLATTSGANTVRDALTRQSFSVGALRFPSDWAFNHVLFGASPWYWSDSRPLKFRLSHNARAPGRPGEVREEAFPELWNDAPESLAELLDRSRTLEVHQFAIRALRANRDAWGRIPIPRLIGWFSSPYGETAQLAADVAVTRYDPNDPDLELVRALLDCPHAEARATAIGWVRNNPVPFLRDAPFVTSLVLSPIAETRRVALEVLGASSMMPEHAREVVRAVVAAVMRLGTTVSGAAEESAETTDRVRDIAVVLAAAFGRELAELPLETVTELLRHPQEGVAELGARILLVHRVRPADLPDEVLAAAMTSVFPVVRGMGIRLYGELPDAVLAERFRVLVHLVTNEHADVRAAVVPIVVRLSSSNPGFARVLLNALLPLLCGEGNDGMHRDVVRLLRTDLAGMLPSVDASQVFRLLRAKESIVQELGGELLRTNVDPTQMTPAQLSILASSDVLGVRRTAWIMLDARTEAVRADPEAILPLLDARWEDSRQRAFEYVRTRIGTEALPSEIVLAICDSVRPDVQAFGRSLVVHRFEHEDGARYLLRLAQHPVAEMQAFAATWLEQHAAGNPERISRLAPFMVTVLTRPNRGRVSKIRVLAFLESQLPDRGAAEVIAPMVSGLVLTSASSHRARYVAMLATIRRLHPDLAIPMKVVEPEVRDAV